MLVLDARGVILGTPRVRPLSPLIEYDAQRDAIISPLSGYADHIRMWRGKGTRAVHAQRAHGVVQTVTSLIVSTVPQTRPGIRAEDWCEFQSGCRRGKGWTWIP